MKYMFNLICAVTLLMLINGCASKEASVEDGINDDALGSAVANVVNEHEDIELPSDMKVDNQKSMVTSTDSFRGGIIHYYGNIEVNSLKSYIIGAMKKNKWKYVSGSTSKDILLAFTKPSKTCMVVINEGWGMTGPSGTTHVTMYVTYDMTAGKQLDAFGDPMK